MRISTQGQDDEWNAGLDTQNAKLLRFCQENNLSVKSTTKEIGSGYYRGDCTPRLSSLIKNLKRGDFILVYTVNRFSRNAEKALENIRRIHEKSGYVYSVVDNVTSKDPRFMELVRQGENESREKGIRIHDAYARIRLQGGFIGKKVPFGYTKVRVDDEKLFKLKENPIEQAICRQLEQLYEKNVVRGLDGKIEKEKLTPEQILRYAINTYDKYNWSLKTIKTIINGHKPSCDIIPADPSEFTGLQGMQEIIEAIEEVDNAPVVVPEFYAVKRLHKIREQDGAYQILVEWEGWPRCTWQSIETLHEDIPETVEEFLKNSKSNLVLDAMASIGMNIPMARRERSWDNEEEEEDDL
jgi:DNA invertase Pin-like site-specific DNA recombinase